MPTQKEMSFEPDIIKNGKVVARFARYLRRGECDCVYDSNPDYFVDGNKVYKKVRTPK